MTKDNTSSIEKWWEEFNENPFEALDRLLFRRVFMGELHRNETDESLFRLFQNKSKKIRRQLDELMKEWFEVYWGKSPGSMSSSRWARILQNAFIVVYRLNLGETALLLKDVYVRDKSWIRSLYIAPSRDPEGWLLRTLALCQKDQRLLPVWMRICRWEEDIPIHYTSIGLMGLRKLPDENGEPPGDIPKAFFKGAVSLAEALVEKNMPKCKEFWLREMRAVTALYPRTKQYWAGHFSPFLSYRPDSPPAQWLNKVIPKITDQFGRKSTLYLQPPSNDKRTYFLKLIKMHPLEKFRDELDLFLEGHRAYVYQTGDSYLLVRTFSDIGYRIFRQDSAYALGLVEEAFTWEPYDPFLRSELAVIEAFRGNYSRAEGLLWEAKRRFPEDPQIRNVLAGLLAQQGRYKIAEILYRQTLEDFPSNVVCRAGLAEVLKSQDKFEESEKVYRQTLVDFPSNVVCRTGLAEVLKSQGRLEESEKVYRQTLVDFPSNVVCRNGLAEVLKSQDKFEESEKVYRQTVVDFPSNVVCRTGLAVVLVKKGQKEKAIALLKETLKRFPGDKVAREFLEKITTGKKITGEDEKKLEKEMSEFEKQPKPSVPYLFEGDKQVAIETGKDAAEKMDEQVEPGFEKEKQEEYVIPSLSSKIADVTEIKYNEKLDKEPPKPRAAKTVKTGTEIEKIETELGRISLRHWQSRMAEDEEKEKYRAETSPALEKLLKKAPQHIPALLVNSFWLADLDLHQAENYLSQQAETHPNTLGFHLMELRVKGLLNKELDNAVWNRLIQNFPGRDTVVKLEHTLHEINKGNGSRIHELEKLRKQISKRKNRLPAALQKNEEWVASTIEHGLFKDIDTTQPITEKSFVTIEENFHRNEMVLKSTVEQCICSAI